MEDNGRPPKRRRTDSGKQPSGTPPVQFVQDFDPFGEVETQGVEQAFQQQSSPPSYQLVEGQQWSPPRLQQMPWSEPGEEFDIGPDPAQDPIINQMRNNFKADPQNRRSRGKRFRKAFHQSMKSVQDIYNNEDTRRERRNDVFERARSQPLRQFDPSQRRALIPQRVQTNARPDPHREKWFDRERRKSEGWRGMQDRQVYQRSPYMRRETNIETARDILGNKTYFIGKGWGTAPRTIHSIKPVVKGMERGLANIPEIDSIQGSEPPGSTDYFSHEFRGFPSRPSNRIPKRPLTPIDSDSSEHSSDYGPQSPSLSSLSSVELFNSPISIPLSPVSSEELDNEPDYIATSQPPLQSPRRRKNLDDDTDWE